MNIPPDLLSKLFVEPDNGENLVSRVRLIMFHYGYLLATEKAELILPFEALDSETEHLKLKPGDPFQLPSPRFSDSNNSTTYSHAGLDNCITIEYGDPNFEVEMKEIYNLYIDTYREAIKELLNEGGITAQPSR